MIKLTRENLKLLSEGNIGICEAYFPIEPPLPGEPFDCGCSNLFWCEKKFMYSYEYVFVTKVYNDGFNDI